MAATPGKGHHRGKGALSLPVALFFFLIAVYLLSFSGDFHSADEMATFAVTQSLVQRGRFDIEPLRWMGRQQGAFGPDGLLYSKYGLGISLLALPLQWLAALVPAFGNVQTTMLLNALVTALTAVLLLHFTRRMGYSRGVALATALLFGLATPAWVYAKYFFGEPLTALCLLAAAYGLRRWREGDGPGWALAAGAAAGYALTTRLVDGALAVPWLALYGFWPRRWERALRDRRWWVGAVAFAAPLALALAGHEWYTLARFGRLGESGYHTGFFAVPLLTGLYGLLFSPGRGLFPHAPILLLGVAALPLAWRRQRAETLLIGAISGVYLLLYGTWRWWFGGDCWGPRHILPLLPFAALLLPPALDWAGKKRRWRPWTVGTLATLSAVAQLGGVLVAFGVYTMKEGAAHGLELYDPRFFFDPRYAALIGHWRVLGRDTLDVAWMRVMAAGQSPQVDWLPLLAEVGLVAVSGWALWTAWRGETLAKVASKTFARVTEGAGRPVALCLLTLAVAALALSRAYGDADGRRGDFRLLVAAIEARARPGDAIVYHTVADTAALLEVYKGRWPVHSFRDDFEPARSEAQALAEDILPRYRRVWFVDYAASPGGVVEDRLLADGYGAGETRYGQLRLNLYALPADRPPLGPQTTRFGEVLSLTGAGWDGAVATGDVLRLELDWQAVAPAGEDYQLFVHVLDGDGRLVAQRDVWQPTSAWAVGTTHRMRLAVPLPPDLPSGQYRLNLGWYRLADGRRLSTDTGDDHLALGHVEVQ